VSRFKRTPPPNKRLTEAMSFRPRTQETDVAQKLRSDIQELKNSHSVKMETVGSDISYASPSLKFEDLSHTEQACASLGVSPDQFRPLAFLNNGHYDQLIKSNMVDDNLVRRLEAYKIVASRG